MSENPEKAFPGALGREGAASAERSQKLPPSAHRAAAFVHGRKGEETGSPGALVGTTGVGSRAETRPPMNACPLASRLSRRAKASCCAEKGNEMATCRHWADRGDPAPAPRAATNQNKESKSPGEGRTRDTCGRVTCPPGP